MGRAMLCLLDGDLAGALGYHLLSIPVLLLGLTITTTWLAEKTLGLSSYTQFSRWLNRLPSMVWWAAAAVLALNWARAFYLRY